MSDKSREITLKVDAKYYSLIKEYSEYSNKSEQYILNRLIEYSLKGYAEKYANLKKGYQKMAELNLEIAKAFEESESEAFNESLSDR